MQSAYEKSTNLNHKTISTSTYVLRYIHIILHVPTPTMGYNLTAVEPLAMREEGHP